MRLLLDDFTADGLVLKILSSNTSNIRIIFHINPSSPSVSNTDKRLGPIPVQCPEPSTTQDSFRAICISEFYHCPSWGIRPQEDVLGILCLAICATTKIDHCLFVQAGAILQDNESTDFLAVLLRRHTDHAHP
jgi:hypothetical protein